MVVGLVDEQRIAKPGGIIGMCAVVGSGVGGGVVRYIEEFANRSAAQLTWRYVT
jgi:hypothetical protein